MNREQMRFAKRVKKQVLAEYKHVVMDAFLTRIKKTVRWAELGCGTTGCIAGHCILIKYPHLSVSQSYEKDMMVEGMNAFGISMDEANDLFMFHTYREGSPYAEELYRLRAYSPGTQGYSAVVATAIDKCITRNYKGTSR